MRLARELGATVESLFAESPDDRPIVAEYGASGLGAERQRIMLARIGGHLVAVPTPAISMMLTPSGGLVSRALRNRRVEVTSFRSEAEIDATLVVAGCDPGVAILRDYLARHQPTIELAAISGSSREALAAVVKGTAHVAGIHLRDARSGEYNLGAARAAFAGKRFRMINFARWELGLATRSNGPSIKTVEDLMRPAVKLINREPGAGARAALDEALNQAGINGATQIAGYEKLAAGHLEVAAAIAGGTADAGVTIRLAASLYALDFQPWREERYDLIVAEDEFDSAPVRGLMEALNARLLAREIGELCAYDTADMGRIEAPSP